jgi:hypothetical protein
MRIYSVSWGYGVLVTMAENADEARAKFLKDEPELADVKQQRDGSTYRDIDYIQEQQDEVEYYGE